MAKYLLPALLVVAFGLSLACADQQPAASTQADPAAVSRWVAQLGSDRFDEREAAFAALEAQGAAALEGLRKAVASHDEELRRRAIDLVLRIEKRLEAAQLTRPSLVHLVYKDTPVNQAVQEIAKKTGIQIQLEGDQNKFANRKITLDTGESPFWQALDQFCQKAGLAEKGSDALVEPPPNVAYGMNNVVFFSDVSVAGPRVDMPLVLQDAKPWNLPTHYAGAMRVRVLPRIAPSAPGVQDGTPLNVSNDEIPLTFQISPEPKMGLQTILNVRVDKVIDDQGMELKTPLPYFSDPFENSGVQLWRGGLGNSVAVDGTGQEFSKRVPIRLNIPADVKKLNEIRGFVSAEVLTPSQPLITLEDILNAADRKVVGVNGDSMKILEVKRDEKGQVILRIVIEKASTPTAAFNGGLGGVIALPGGGFGRVLGGAGGPAAQPDAASNAIAEFLSLVDDKNQAFKLIAAEDQALDGQSNEYRLTFQPPSGLPKAAKLVYSGRRQTTIDVPFVLRDVPVRGDKSEPKQLAEPIPGARDAIKGKERLDK